MTKYKIKVSVKQLCETESLTDPDDKIDQPSGDYIFEKTANNREQASELALDEFHLTVPIGCLEDYDISTECILITVY